MIVSKLKPYTRDPAYVAAMHERKKTADLLRNRRNSLDATRMAFLKRRLDVLDKELHDARSK